MSPARQMNGSPRGTKIGGRTSNDPILQTAGNAIGPSLVVKKKRDFDPHAFLATLGEGRKSLLFQKKQGIFAQGDTADAVFYLQTGKVKLTVVSKTGKEATVGIVGEGAFFGEGSLAGQALRMDSATAMTEEVVDRLPAAKSVTNVPKGSTPPWNEPLLRGLALLGLPAFGRLIC
jgi:hypothetical protein